MKTFGVLFLELKEITTKNSWLSDSPLCDSLSPLISTVHVLPNLKMGKVYVIGEFLNKKWRKTIFDRSPTMFSTIVLSK